VTHPHNFTKKDEARTDGMSHLADPEAVVTKLADHDQSDDGDGKAAAVQGPFPNPFSRKPNQQSLWRTSMSSAVSDTVSEKLGYKSVREMIKNQEYYIKPECLKILRALGQGAFAGMLDLVLVGCVPLFFDCNKKPRIFYFSTSYKRPYDPRLVRRGLRGRVHPRGWRPQAQGGCEAVASRGARDRS
jgi:hypothetical protein